jgi:ELWxxDGT repeat protein
MRVPRVLPLVALGLLACLPAGAQAPAFLVRDINTSQPERVVYRPGDEAQGVGSLYYFLAEDGIHGTEVWRTDGTAAGTFLLKDICPGDCTSSPHALTGSNGLLFFIVDDSQHGPQLWKSDGTPEGTSLVKDDLFPAVAEFIGGYVRIPMIDAGGKLFFTAASPSGSPDLWVTDGTAAGTHQVGASPGAFSVRRFLAAGNGELLFAAEDGFGVEPWVSDGTGAGTHRVADLNPDTGSSISVTYYVAAPSGKDAVAAPWGGFILVADDGVHGPELWRTDGTAAGTSLIRDIVPGSAGSSPYGLTAANGKAVFAATDSNGTEIWVTDGTSAGTLPLRDIGPGAASSSPQELTAVGGKVFFRAADGLHGSELWATDGTPAGTWLVKDLDPGPADGFPATSIGYSFTPLGDRLLFYLPTALAGGMSFWTSDGTDAGTQPVSVPGGSWPYVDLFSLSNNAKVARRPARTGSRRSRSRPRRCRSRTALPSGR